MRAVIISGGRIIDYEFTKSQIADNDTIICADSGYNHAAQMGLLVSAVVGDFDSIGDTVIAKNTATMRVPAKKDLTDTELALGYARERGYRDFLFIAAMGTRLDHSLANILLLKGCIERGEHAVIVDEHNKIMLTNSALILNEPPGSTVSLIPLDNCHDVITQGLEYPLRGEALMMGKGLGISNVMVSEHAEISIKTGLLLVIVAKD